MTSPINRMILDACGRGARQAEPEPVSDRSDNQPAPRRVEAGGLRRGIKGPVQPRQHEPAGELFRAALKASQREQRERVYSDGVVRGVERAN